MGLLGVAGLLTRYQCCTVKVDCAEEPVHGLNRSRVHHCPVPVVWDSATVSSSLDQIVDFVN